MENISKRLIEAGIVQDMTADPSRGRSRRLTLRPTGAHAIGIGLTPDYCSVALCQFDGRTVSAQQLENRPVNPDRILRWLSRTVPDLIDDAGAPLGTVLGAGISWTTLSSSSADPPGEPAQWPGRRELQQRLRLPTLGGSDVLAAVSGERWSGHLTARDAIYVHLGATVSGAIISNGQINSGATGRSGAIAHLTADRNGPPCGCGRIGCLAMLIGETPLRTFAARALRCAEPPSIVAMGRLAPSCASMADVVDRAAWHLVHALLPAVQLLDPDALVIGGPTVDSFGESFRAAVSQYLADAHGPHPAVGLAQPAAGGAASAATLVLQQVFTPTVDHLLLGGR